MREIRQSGYVEHTARLVTPVPVLEEFPKIGLPALLRLIDWLHARRQEPQSGGPSCIHPQPSLSSPRPPLESCPLILSRLWSTLPVENRERILNALSRLVAQHLKQPPNEPEVKHERP